MKRIPRTIAIFGLSTALTAPVNAEHHITARDRTDIARIEAYLNSLESLRSKFVQSSGSRFAEGNIYINGPKNCGWNILAHRIFRFTPAGFG